MRPRYFLWLELYQFAAGFSDTITGLLLLLAPAWTLRLMRVNQPPQPIVFASYIGAFVLGVGLTYLWVALRSRLSGAATSEWESQWRSTALIRACVAVFIAFQVATSHMESAWMAVAAFDGLLAILQLVGVRRSWLRFGDD